MPAGSRRWRGALLALVIGCGVDSGGSPPLAPERVSTSTQALSSCQGDDLQYDHNAFAASLAIAIAQELGRWEVTTDFEVIDARLQLSDTGELRCQGSCDNVRSLLRLQEDASADIPGHDPELFRSKLAGWYEKQLQSLSELVDDMLTVDKGVYRVRVQHSGKLMVAGASTWYSNRVEQRDQVSQAGDDEWRLFLVGTKHELVNVRSGKCLALGVDSGSNGVALVSRFRNNDRSSRRMEIAA
jgi:hypothetical protein